MQLTVRIQMVRRICIIFSFLLRKQKKNKQKGKKILRLLQRDTAQLLTPNVSQVLQIHVFPCIYHIYLI